MTELQHTPPFLTQNEVDNLPDGTRIAVTWQNGNGPWEYTIERVYFDNCYLYSVGNHTYPWEKGKGILRNVGEEERYHTRVTLLSPDSVKSDEASNG